MVITSILSILSAGICRKSFPLPATDENGGNALGPEFKIVISVCKFPLLLIGTPSTIIWVPSAFALPASVVLGTCLKFTCCAAPKFGLLANCPGIN